MALFKIQVKKQHVGSDHVWSNDYIVSADTLADTADAKAAILSAEVALHQPTVTITEVLTSPYPVSSGDFTVEPLSDAGEGTGTGSELPLFNVLLVKLLPTAGRPGKKYYRLPVTEDRVVGSVFEGGAIAIYNDIIDTMFTDINAAGTPLCKPDGTHLVSGAPQLPVQMRQLHRKRRRTPAP